MPKHASIMWDSAWDDEVIVLSKAKDLISSMHESILHRICAFMSVEQLINFKQSCILCHDLVRPTWVIERMIFDYGPGYTLSLCIYRNNLKHVKYMMTKDVPMKYITKGFIYCLFNNRKEMALLLLENVCVENSDEVYDVSYYAYGCYLCQEQECFMHYIKEDAWDIYGNNRHDKLTTKGLMALVCASNAVCVLKHVMTRYDISCGHDELATAVMYGSNDIIGYLCNEVGLKVGRKLIRCFLETCKANNKWECLEYMLSNKLAKLPGKSIPSLCAHASKNNEHSRIINRIINAYAKMRYVNQALVQLDINRKNHK
jgi:hypothetical protein